VCCSVASRYGVSCPHGVQHCPSCEVAYTQVSFDCIQVSFACIRVSFAFIHISSGFCPSCEVVTDRATENERGGSV